ncbi:MAG TPA: hypothetical protein VHQ94_21550 [Pyrinomonadaceae bacterium]|jgi:hypothetical protein|nr:hypothetical protein [Pyrinomonadaceae bacterium]
MPAGSYTNHSLYPIKQLPRSSESQITIFVAIQLEDRDLIDTYGDDYTRYTTGLADDRARAARQDELN